MKLNHECVRDLLLAIESLPTGSVWYDLSHLMENTSLQQYSIEEIAYTATCLDEAGFIKVSPNYREPQFYSVQRLTWKGHEFLDNIRDNKIWTKVKEKASVLSSVSISILSDMGSKIVSNFFNLD